VHVLSEALFISCFGSWDQRLLALAFFPM